MQEKKDELLALRSQIVAQTNQLALGGTGSPDSRLQILLETIRSGEATVDMYRSAYEIMQNFSNDDDKMNAMLDLLFEIDKDLSTEDVNKQ